MFFKKSPKALPWGLLAGLLVASAAPAWAQQQRVIRYAFVSSENAAMG